MGCTFANKMSNFVNFDAFDMLGFWLGFPFNMLGYSRMCRYYIFLEDIQRINTK